MAANSPGRGHVPPSPLHLRTWAAAHPTPSLPAIFFFLVGLNFFLAAFLQATSPRNFILVAGLFVAFGSFAAAHWLTMSSNPNRGEMMVAISSVLAAIAIPAGFITAALAPPFGQSIIPLLLVLVALSCWEGVSKVRSVLARRRWDRLPESDKVETEAAVRAILKDSRL